MANYQLLKADIDEKVYENAQQKITGENLNSVLNQMVTTLGAEYQFAGVATIETTPGTPDAKVFYIANGKGTYTNFGGLEVTEDEVVVLYWDTAWHKVSTGIASQAKLSELESEIDKLPSSEIGLDDFSIGDEFGCDVFSIKDGHIKSKHFSSKEINRKLNDLEMASVVDKDLYADDFAIGDNEGNNILKIEKGHIKTKMFDSNEIPHIRAGHVLWKYKDFGQSSAEILLSSDSYNEDARQIIAKCDLNLTRHKFGCTINCNEGSSIYSFGNYNTFLGILTYMQVSGNKVSIKARSLGGDTYPTADLTIIYMEDLPFTISRGERYNIGYDRFEMDDTKGQDGVNDGVIFFIEDYNGNRYEKKILRTDSIVVNGYRFGLLASMLGSPFVGVNQGSAIISGLYVSSADNPHSKLMIFGHSWVAGDTMSPNQSRKYANKIKNAIGVNDVTVVGIGGESVERTKWLQYYKILMKDFLPDYVLIMSGNSRDLVRCSKNIEDAIKYAKSIGCVPIVQTFISPETDNQVWKDGVIAINNWIRNNKDCIVFDVAKLIVDDGTDISKVGNPYLLSDLLHPNEYGHSYIFEAIKKYIPQIFNN